MLIAGAGPNQLGLYLRARDLGIVAIAASGVPEPVSFRYAPHTELVDIRDGAQLARIARRYRVDGIYPGAEITVEAVAHAAELCDLPGIPLEVARRVRDKYVMRQALAEAGLPGPAFRLVRNAEEAARAAEAIGYPVIVKPTDSYSSHGVRRVDHREDIDAAAAMAIACSGNRAALIEEVMDGEEYCVDGLVYGGLYTLGGITGKWMSPLPYRFDKGIHMPPRLAAADCSRIVACVEASLRAIGFREGITHAEVMLTSDGPKIVEIAGRPGGGRIPTDLIPECYGYDFIGDSLRIALGSPPESSRDREGGVALYWLEAEPGIVSAIEGLEKARAIPGVREVVVQTRVGDLLSPIVDCLTRDRVGYVFTVGYSVEDAIATAQQAMTVCRIRTTMEVQG